MYGPGVGRWAMTERCQKALKPSADGLAIGPSAVIWEGSRLRIEIDEKAPLTMAPLRGTVILEPEILPTSSPISERAAAIAGLPLRRALMSRSGSIAHRSPGTAPAIST